MLHLDQAGNLDIIRKANEHGFTSVMFDGSQLPFRENIARSRAVVDITHAHGVAVEAELGVVARKSLLTEPREKEYQCQNICWELIMAAR